MDLAGHPTALLAPVMPLQLSKFTFNSFLFYWAIGGEDGGKGCKGLPRFGVLVFLLRRFSLLPDFPFFFFLDEEDEELSGAVAPTRRVLPDPQS